MSGVDRILITTIESEGTTANVTGVKWRDCAGTLTTVAPGPWNAAVPAQSGNLIVETFIPYNVLSSTGSLPLGMHHGFVFQSGSQSQSALSYHGSLILYPDPTPPKARIVEVPDGKRTIVLDGQKNDWGNVQPAFDGGVSSGASSLTLSSVHIWGNGTNLYFMMQGSVRPVAAPIANDDGYTATEESPLVVGPRGVLDNDTDADGNALPVAGVTASEDSSTSNGGLTLNPDGSFTYTPNPNFDGNDSFTYHVNDDHGLDSNTATATITVNGVNDAPVNTVPASATTAEDTPLAFTGVNNISVADIDAGSDAIQVTLSVTNGTLSVSSPPPGTSGNGTATIVMTASVAAINAALNGLTFQPALNYVGPATLTVTTSDLGHNGTGGTLTDTDSVAITVTAVNDPPIANGDPKTTAEDTPLAFAAATLTVNDSPGPADESGQTLTVTAVSPTSANGGTVTLVAGTITYTPAANFNGIDTFTYTVTDNGTPPLSSNGTVTVTVTEVNDAPAATADAISTAEDTPSIFAAATLTTNDSKGPANESGQTLTVTGVSAASAQGGTVTLVAGTITYTPPLNYFGADSFTYTVSDNGTTNGVPAPLTANGTVNVTVTAVNDAPVLTVTGAVTHTEGGAATNVATAANIVDVDDTNIESATIQITGNFAAGQDVLAFTNTPNISGSFVGSTLTLTGSDTKANYIAALLAITYTNTSDTPSTLQRTLTWRVNDGSVDSNTQNTTLDVTATNDPPVNTLPAAQNTNEDTPLTLTGPTRISIADVDANPDDVQVTLNVANGTVTLNPLATGALTSLTGDGTNTVVATGTLAEINAALDGMVFSPTLDFFGSASIQVVTDDLGNNPSGSQTDTDTLTITVNAVNDAPVLTVTGAISFNEGDPATNAATTANIVDPDDTNIEGATVQITGNFAGGEDVLSFVSAPPISGSFVGDTMTLTGSDTKANYIAALQAIQYVNASQNPSMLQRTLTWKVNDGSVDSNTQTTTINVTAINDPPVNSLPAAQNTNEDTPKVLSTGNGNAISISDVDANGEDVQVTLNVTLGTVTLNAGATGALTSLTGDGTNTVVATGTIAEINAALDGLTFSPTLDSNGPGAIQIVTDDLGNNPSGNQTDTDTLTITINAVNDAPVLTVAASPTPTFAENGSAINAATSANITDVDDTNIESATIQISNNFQSGADVLSFVNAPPISGSFVGDTLTLSGGDTKANYIAALLAVKFSNTSDNSSTLQRTLTWKVNDGDVDSNTQTTFVDVTATNDAPVNTLPAGVLSTNEDTDLSGLVFSIADPDVGTNDLDVQLIVTGGVITLNSIAGMTEYTNGDGTLDAFIRFKGPLSAWNNALNGVTFRPSPLNSNGAASIQIITSDQGFSGAGGTLTDDDTKAITVNAVNDPPVNSVPGAQTINEEATLTFSSGNGNPISISDVESLTAQVQLTSTNGTLTLSGITGLSFTVGDGTADATMTFSGNITAINTALNGLVYAPGLNVNGAQSVTIVTNDQGNTGAGGVQSDTDSVTVNVTAVNDAPVNTVPGGQTMNQDSVFTFTGGTQISVADVDAGGNSIQVQLTGTNGTITLSGTTGLSFSVGDGTADATMTFTGTITNINTALNNLQFASSPGFFSGPNAVLAIVTDDLGFTGTGGALQDSDSVNIFVQQVNQPPVNSVPGTQTINEDATLTFSVGNSNLISISDPDAGVATVQVQLTVTTGTLTLSGTSGLSFVFSDGNGTGAGDGTADATMTFRGTIANINTALAGMTFSGGANVNGSSTLTIVTNDLGNTGPGGPMTDTDNVTINITAVNDAPVITRPATATVAEDAVFTFNGGNVVSVADVDAGAGSITVALSVSNGTLTLSGTTGLSFSVGDGTADAAMTFSGTLTNVNNALNNMTYQGTLNFNGSDTLNINANDNGNTGTGGALSDSKSTAITITAVNDAPVNTVPGLQTFNEDTTLTFSTGNGNAISVADVDAAPGNVQVALSTTAGTMTLGSLVGLSFSLGDGTADASMTFQGTLAAVNTALQGMTFTPTLNLNGAQTIGMTTSDLGNTGAGGTLTDTDTINLSITAVNDAPVLTVPGPVAATEDVQTGSIAISVTDVDSGAGTNFQATLSVTNGLINVTPSGATVGGNNTNSVTITGTVAQVNTALGTTKYTGNSNFNGTDTMVVNVTDNGQTGTGGTLTDGPDNITINVAAVNDKPVALAKNFTAQAHMRINGLTGLLTGVTDPDNGTGPGPCVSTTFTLISITPTNAGGTTSITDASTGTFDFFPAAGFVGNATFDYVVQDTGCPGTAQSDPATITIAVAGPIIYFVKNPAVGTADCRLGSECLIATAVTNIAANAAMCTTAGGCHIFMSDAATHTAPAIVLGSGYHIMGQGVTPPVDGDGVLTDNFDDLFDIAPPAGTIARPGINTTRPTASFTTAGITLNTNSQARGFNISTTAANALTSPTKTGLRVSDMNVSSSAAGTANFAVDFTSSSGRFDLGTVTMSNTGSAVRFATTTSTNTVTLGNISASAGQGFASSGTGTTNFTGNNVSSTSGVAVTIGTAGTGDFTFNDITSTTGTAVSVATATGDLTFHAINANGSTTNGITVTGFGGTFTVNGTSTTAGTGGTIQNAVQHGAAFTGTGGASKVTLKNMNFTGNGTANLSDPTVPSNCGDNVLAAANTEAKCAAGISLTSLGSTGSAGSGSVLTNVTVSGGVQVGINVQGGANLTMTDCTVSGVGNQVAENGLQMGDLQGTATITDSDFTNNAANQIDATLTTAATANLIFNINGTVAGNSLIRGFTAWPTNGTSNNGIRIQSYANNRLLDFSSTDVNYTNNFSGALGVRADTGGDMIVDVLRGVFNDNGLSIDIGGQGTGDMTYTINDITSTQSPAHTVGSAIVASKLLNASGTWNGTVTNCDLGTAGVQESGGPGAGVAVIAGGTSGSYTVSITNNIIREVGQNSINVSAGKNVNNDSSQMNMTINSNTISNTFAASGQAIFAQSGAGSGDTTKVCGTVSGNTITGSYTTSFIRLRNRFTTTTFKIPGFPGPFTGDNGPGSVAPYISGLNGSVSVTATSTDPVSAACPYTGGVSCP